MVEAHLADPGRLRELLLPGVRLYLRSVDHPKRRTKWSVVLVETEESVLVSLQSTLVNQLTAQALEQWAIPELAGWELIRPEYAHGSSRWDFLLGRGSERLLLEVKSCTLVQAGEAMFPDAVTARGTRHIRELTELQAGGELQGAVLFVVQREDAGRFRPADHIDPAFGQALREAQQQGVQILVYACRLDRERIIWGQKLPAHLT